MPLSFAALRLTCALLGSAVALAHAAPATPPLAAVIPVSESHFGTTVIDPYRWMEDLSSPRTQQWAKGQAAYARSVLDAIPGRGPLLERIAALEASVAERVTNVHRLPNGMIFYEKRGAKDSQFKLFVRQGLAGMERLLVDPQAAAKAAGAPHAIDFYRPSPDGRYVAYGISDGGSEEAAIHVIDVATRQPMIEPIDRAHYSDANWMPDASGFFYLRQRALPQGAPETEKYRNQTAYFRRLNGHGPDRAIIVAGRTDRIKIATTEFPSVVPVIGTPYTVAIPGNGVQNEFDLYVAPTARVLDPKLRWRKLFGREAGITSFAIRGDDLYLLSHQNAPRFKVVKTSLAHPDLKRAQLVVAPSREIVTGISAAADALYVQARDGTIGKLYSVAYTDDARPEPVRLPASGAVTIEDSDARMPDVLVSIGSWTHDEGFYAADPKTGAYVDTGLQSPGPFGAPANIESKEVLVRSHDNVEVPLSIVHPKGIRLDGSNPVHLYGYGAYGMTTDPVYLPRFLAWYELGGIRATCHVRGGGVYGEEWHLGGKLQTKPNTWKDLIACAEYLIEAGYTSAARLAINGGSAGGILVGRAMTERPDLFAVAVPEVGDLNTLRAETSANGVPNIPEFGTVKNHQQFDALLEMDAYHHVHDGVKYPATLLLTGINDSRVPPWESFKMAARL